MRLRIALAAAAATLVLPQVAAAAPYPLPGALLLDGAAASTVERTVATFGRFDVGGASVAVGELTGDGADEIVLAEGLGKEPRLRVFDGTGKMLSTFLAYDKSFGRGVTVAVGDVDGDGSRDIVTGTDYGGGPHVRVFDRDGTELFRRGGFFAYNPAFRGGVHVTTADVDGDGADEIVTAPGFSGGPHVRAFRPDGTLVMEFFAFAPDMTQGITVAGGDFDGDGRDELAVAREGAGPAELRIYRFVDGAPHFAIGFRAAPDGQHAGVALSAADVDGDGKDEIVAAQNGGRGVRAYTFGGLVLREWAPYPKGTVDAVRAAAADVDGDGHVELVTAPHAAVAAAEPRPGRSITVDLARQQLFAWQDGRLANTFLVSSGTRAFPSPTGEYAVFRKVAKMDYRWSYGPGNPNNYNLPNVPWNLNFKPRYYIHAAYWHNNFGVPMSHGCINVSIDNADWIYHWADVGTTVAIR